jgi:hypothetical protein
MVNVIKRRDLRDIPPAGNFDAFVLLFLLLFSFSSYSSSSTLYANQPAPVQSCRPPYFLFDLFLRQNHLFNATSVGLFLYCRLLLPLLCMAFNLLLKFEYSLSWTIFKIILLKLLTFIQNFLFLAFLLILLFHFFLFG